MKNVCLLTLLVFSCHATLTPPSCPHMCTCMPHLSSVSCRDVPYEHLRDQLNSYPELKTLLLNNVSLHQLSESTLSPQLASGLSHVTWTGSKIHNLAGKFLATLPHVEVLDLSHNQIETISDNAFANNLNLKQLNLSHNQVTDIQPRAFDDLDHLRVLDLNHNQFDLKVQVFSALYNLEQLDLTYNRISMLDSYYFLPNKRLSQLYLSHNKIAGISEQAFVPLHVLQDLDLSYNAISSLPLHIFNSLEQLQRLNISHNTLTSVINDTFVPLTNLKNLDLSSNELTYLSDTSFSRNTKLQVLRLDNTLITNIKTELLSPLTNLFQLSLSHNSHLASLDNEIFYHKPKLRDIDLSHNALTRLPHSLTGVNLSSLDMTDNPWTCDCHMAWYAEWWSQNKHKIVPNRHGVFCSKTIYPDLVNSALIPTLRGLNCTPAEIISTTATTYFLPDQNITLDCVVTGEPTPTITWLTPQGWTFHWLPEQSVSPMFRYHPVVHDVRLQPVHQTHLLLLHNGSLIITHFNREDRGNYSCFISNPFSNATRLIPVKMDPIIIYYAKMESIAFGWFCAFLFLLLTLLVQLIIHLCKRCCKACKRDSQPKQIQIVLDNIDQVRAQQLNRLQENYTLQVAKIKENYVFQSEKIRESYKDQVENLKTIKRNGTTHLVSLREQYSDQMLRVRDYSTGQLSWVRENYVFQRNRIRKFSAHQMIRIRQNYKYQQQALNKMLESLPTLDNCKSSCGYSMSTVYDETEQSNHFKTGTTRSKGPVLSDAESLTSLYFTPPGQLSPQGPPVRTHGAPVYTKLQGTLEDDLKRTGFVKSSFSKSDLGLADLRYVLADGPVANPGPSYSMTGGQYVPPTNSRKVEHHTTDTRI